MQEVDPPFSLRYFNLAQVCVDKMFSCHRKRSSIMTAAIDKVREKCWPRYTVVGRILEALIL